MGILREFNPKMVLEWHQVPFPTQENDKTITTNSLGWKSVDWKAFNVRRDEAVDWCKGNMIHGRFSFKEGIGGSFFFKSKRDAMTFKLAFSGR
jgi:hypothetical protein